MLSKATVPGYETITGVLPSGVLNVQFCWSWPAFSTLTSSLVNKLKILKHATSLCKNAIVFCPKKYEELHLFSAKKI